MKYQEVTYEGFIIHQYPDGSCTALGQVPFIEIKAAKKAIREYNQEKSFNDLSYQGYFQLAPLPKAQCPCPNWDYINFPDGPKECQQEGKTPMRYNDNYASASATVAAQPTDTAVTRDYLLTRLVKADYPKEQALSELFNLNVNNTPKTYQQMIDIIKAGTYTIDSKVAADLASAEADADDWYRGAMHGIIWPGPQPDRKGYAAAIEQKRTQYTAVKDTIMVADAAAGLKALQDFEAWLPTPATVTA